MKYLLALLIVSTGAMAGPEYVTMKNGAVCEVVVFGNAGSYGWENFLGMDYEDCSFPGIEAIQELQSATPPDMPECAEEDGLVVGGSTSRGVYPCYVIMTKPAQCCRAGELCFGGSTPCE